MIRRIAFDFTHSTQRGVFRSGRVVRMAHIALVLIAFTLPTALAANSPDHTNMKVLVERNQSDLRFFDTAISNLPLQNAEGQPDTLRAEVIELFKEALRHDYYANLFYLQGQYSPALKEMRKSQNFLQQAYEKVLQRYLDTTLALLDTAAPIALRTRDQAAGHFLRTGFRNLAHARNFHTRGYNINPRYHTNQLHYYRSGIERARNARKYGLLAMIEARLPLEERDQYQLITYDDVRTGARKGDPKMNDYTRVATLLRNMIQRRLVPAEIGTRNLPVPIVLPLMELHQDSHGRLIDDRASVWLAESDQLNVSRFYSDYALPKRNLENRNEVPAEDSDPVDLKVAPGTEDTPNAGAGEQGDGALRSETSTPLASNDRPNATPSSSEESRRVAPVPTSRTAGMQFEDEGRLDWGGAVTPADAGATDEPAYGEDPAPVMTEEDSYF